MLAGLSLLQLVGLAVLGAMGLIAMEAIKLILQNEYKSWASALARLLTWLAGRLYRPRRYEWWADLRYAQKDGNQTGVVEAAFWLASTPGFAVRDVAAALGSRRSRSMPSMGRLLVELAVRLYPPLTSMSEANIFPSSILDEPLIQADTTSACRVLSVLTLRRQRITPTMPDATKPTTATMAPNSAAMSVTFTSLPLTVPPGFGVDPLAPAAADLRVRHGCGVGTRPVYTPPSSKSAADPAAR